MIIPNIWENRIDGNQTAKQLGLELWVAQSYSDSDCEKPMGVGQSMGARNLPPVGICGKHLLSQEKKTTSK